jgi:hypothetical protein
MADKFFTNLPAIIRYSDLIQTENYTDIPKNWCVAVSDVKFSTRHIEYGDVRAVNISGAMIIAALSNHFSDMDLPFQFTGDGSIVAFPSSLKPDAEKIIMGCRQLANKAFRLELRAGVLDLSDDEFSGDAFKVAKFRLSPSVHHAAFAGNGFQKLDELIREQNPLLADLSPKKSIKPDLSGLECRWNAFPADKKAVCLIVTSRKGSAVYDDVLADIATRFGDESRLAPVRLESMKLSLNPKHLLREIRAQNPDSGFSGRVLSLIKLYALQIIGSILMRFGIKTSATDWGSYKPDFIRNSDYRKFNNGLRLIFNAPENEIAPFKDDLEKRYQDEEIIYGMSISNAAITTCYVKNYQKNHIHFIDGEEGGYTRASIDYKDRESKIS